MISMANGLIEHDPLAHIVRYLAYDPTLAKYGHHSCRQSSIGLNTQVTSHHPHDLKIQSLQQQMHNLQQQIQVLQASSGASTLSGLIIGSTSLANSSKTSILLALSTLSSKESYQSSWILDLGATDHMTPIPYIFASYEPCTTGYNIQIANSTLLEVAGIGSVHIDPTCLVSTVLHVPKFFISLVSVQRIAKLEEFRIFFRILMHFSIIRFTSRGLDLLKSNEGCDTYLIRHPTVEGLLTLGQQW